MEITDKLVEQMPDVQENAIDQLAGDKKQEQEQVKDPGISGEHAGLVDRMGRTFSRAIHLTDEKDEPKLTKAGKLKIRRGQGPDAKTAESKIGGMTSTPGIGFAQTQAAAEAEIIVTGQSAASLTFLLGIMVFKEDGKPTQDEINQVTYAYQTYFRAKNIRDLPPGVILATALIVYAGPRLMKPKTSKKIGVLWEKVKKRYSRKKRTPESNEAGHTDTEA